MTPTPLHVDSIGTVRVGTDEKSVKNSVWVRRKVRVLNDGHDQGEVSFTHIDEADNVSDGASKPIKRAVASRHSLYLSGQWG